VIQQKTDHPVRFEITADTRRSLCAAYGAAYIEAAGLTDSDPLFPSQLACKPHLSAKQYARCFKFWVRKIGIDDSLYGSHSMGRTQAPIIYSRIKNSRAVQILLGHTKLNNTVRCLGVDEEDALDLAERTLI